MTSPGARGSTKGLADIKRSVQSIREDERRRQAALRGLTPLPAVPTTEEIARAYSALLEALRS